MVASANGVVAWRRADPHDDPVLAILGGDRRRPARVADKKLMRFLRCFGDVAVGAETVRTQPELLLSPPLLGRRSTPAGVLTNRPRGRRTEVEEPWAATSIGRPTARCATCDPRRG